MFVVLLRSFARGFIKVWPVSSCAQQLPANVKNMQQGVQTDATSKNVGSRWPLIRRSFERGFKKEEIAGAAENCQVLETNNKNFLKVEMLSSILKSLISVKVQTRSKKVAKYVFQETNNYQRQGRYEDFYTDNVSPFGCRALQWNMYITMQYDTVVCNNAVTYRSSHHLPVTVERNTHTQSNARTLHLKWSLLALHMGQHPNLLRL